MYMYLYVGGAYICWLKLMFQLLPVKVSIGCERFLNSIFVLFVLFLYYINSYGRVICFISHSTTIFSIRFLDKPGCDILFKC